MQCFTMSDRVVPWLQGYFRSTPAGPAPYFQQPPGAPWEFRLDTPFSRLLAERGEGQGGFRVGYNPTTRTKLGIDLLPGLDAVYLGLPKRWSGLGTQALIRFQMEAGDGGAVRLRGPACLARTRGKARRLYRPLSDSTLSPLCTDAYRDQLEEGMPAPDVFLLLSQGAGFCVERRNRNKEFGLTPSFWRVHWTGQQLVITREDRKPWRRHMVQMDRPPRVQGLALSVVS